MEYTGDNNNDGSNQKAKERAISIGKEQNQLEIFDA